MWLIRHFNLSLIGFISMNAPNQINKNVYNFEKSLCNFYIFQMFCYDNTMK